MYHFDPMMKKHTSLLTAAWSFYPHFERSP
jgi:hypothetical protein